MRITMRIALAGLCAILIPSVAALAQVQREQPAPSGYKVSGPRLELSEDEWDFGSVWYNTPLEHELRLMNTGDAPLRIEKVKASCGCTASRLDRHTVLPGESVPMKVTYNSKKQRRSVNTTVTITSDDPSRPSVVYRVKGAVKPCYELAPAVGIAFGSLKSESAATRTVTIQNVYEDRMFLELKEVADTAFDVELRELEPGMRYELSVGTRPPLAAGSRQAFAVLTTDLERVGEIRIPIRAYVMPRVAVEPKTIVVSKALTRPVTRILRVRWPTDEPVRILGVATELPGVETEILPPVPQSGLGVMMQQIRVSLPPGKDLPEADSSLKVLTDVDQPEFAALEVRLTSGGRRSAAAAAGSTAATGPLPANALTPPAPPKPSTTAAAGSGE